MTLGIVRSLQLATTLVLAGPVALVGVLNALDGRYGYGVFFLVVAVGLVVVSEYLYVRLADRTVGRVKRVGSIRGGNDE